VTRRNADRTDLGMESTEERMEQRDSSSLPILDHAVDQIEIRVRSKDAASPPRPVISEGTGDQLPGERGTEGEL
jgi:hypothetical protein